MLMFLGFIIGATIGIMIIHFRNKKNNDTTVYKIDKQDCVGCDYLVYNNDGSVECMHGFKKNIGCNTSQ